jgi:hypothetical protein
VDKGSEVKYDNASKSRYTLLKDGPDVNAITVGRVYFDLKLIIITDQELLAAMTYKNNRNWTLPTPTVELKDTHPEGSSAEPWIQAGKTYFFSYYFSSQSYADDTSYGYNRTAPFQNWVRVDGKNTPDGGKYFPSITFKPDGFPYMRRGTEMESFSGTGWNANVMQILVTEMDNSASGFTGADTVRPQYWTAVTNALGGSNTNGVYVGEAGDDTIDPTYMGTRTFTLKRSDMSALNFDIEGNAPYFVISSAHTSHMDYQNGTGLTFGNETFFNGNVQTTVGLKTEKAVATVSVSKDELNYSRYGGFTSAFNESTYITEVGLLNDQNQLMAVGKPTYPIRKNAARHLIFQLEIDV